jgi:3-oxoacyl-[acyl-carrier-protein] synthase-3
MRISAIDYLTGARVVGYEETIDLFRYYSSRHLSGTELEELMRLIEKLLQAAGFQQCVVKADGQPMYRDFLEMSRAAIETAGLQPSDIDMVVYHAVGKGYKEPATAVQVAARLGLKHPECLDIVDACSGWSKSAKILERLLRADYCRNVLLVGLEQNRSSLLGNDPNKRDAFHNNYSIQNRAELSWRMWGATVGDAGQATVLSKDDANGPWHWDYIHVPHEYQDCAYTLKNHADYDLEPMPHEGVHAPGHEFFWAFGKNIGESTRTYVTELLNRIPDHLRTAEVVIPHSLSANVYAPIFKALGVGGKSIYPYQRFGNCVSCGVPVGIAMAVKEGLLHRGQRVVTTPVGAGAAYGVCSFVY